ncbi:hypothetical protein [Enterococcus viikkiensis]|uniref:hypothetical protein n=1 Tax=Enterococcus viikkiensis TaxID=930854 RepID=UPI003F90D131
MRDEQTEILEKYEPLFYRVLIDCRVFRKNPEHEDYLQTIRLAFIEKSQSLDLASDEQVTLLYRYLCWRVRDLQRQQQRREALLEKLTRYKVDQEIELESRIEWEDYLERLWPKLTIGEQRYLFSRLCLGLTMNQIMAAYQVSRSTVLKWKRQLAKRFTKK